MSDSSPPLDEIATQINVQLEKAAEADDHRIAAGKLLIEARERVKRGEAGDVTWSDWLSQNIKRSVGDVRKVMALARAKAPDTAHDLEKEAAKNRMARLRDQRANVRALPETATVEPAADPQRDIMALWPRVPVAVRAIVFKLLWWGLPASEQTEFLNWAAGTPMTPEHTPVRPTEEHSGAAEGQEPKPNEASDEASGSFGADARLIPAALEGPPGNPDPRHGAGLNVAAPQSQPGRPAADNGANEIALPPDGDLGDPTVGGATGTRQLDDHGLTPTPRINEPEQSRAVLPDLAAAEPVTCGDGSHPQTMARFLALHGGAKSTPSLGIICHHKQGRCGYSGCRACGRCLAMRSSEAAA